MVAAEARKAFFSAVATQDLVGYYEAGQDAADASNDLARRMLQAGNFSKLAQMREQAFMPTRRAISRGPPSGGCRAREAGAGAWPVG